MTDRKWIAGSFVTLCVSIVALGMTASSAFALPEGRHYEMASPVYKGGFGAFRIEAVAHDGDSVAFYSPGAFDGAPYAAEIVDYVARRGVSGWVTSPLMPPAGLMPYVVGHDVSPNLESVLIFGKTGSSEEAAFQESSEEEFLLHSAGSPDVSAAWSLAGMAFKSLNGEPLFLRPVGASSDFCHLVVSASTAVGREPPLLPEAVGTRGQLYELSRGCGGEPVSSRLVGLDNAGRVISPRCNVPVGIENYEAATNSFNAVAAGGDEVFFTTCVGGTEAHSQLFVRLGGERTLEVSKPMSEAEEAAKEARCSEVPCGNPTERANADFVGGSEDGSKAFFMTTASLVKGDVDTGNDLYLAEIGCRESEPGCEVASKVVTSLVQVSHAPNGEPAEVQGVVRVAPDGSRVYFVARGDLLGEAQREALEGEGRSTPRAGADNLYVYDSVSGVTGFVGDLCSGNELSGVVEDLRCPSETGIDSELWSGNDGEAQTAGADGGFLVFSTYAQLVAGDDDNAKDVYRYDAETGVLDRVSLGEDGADANGNRNDQGLTNADATIALGEKGGSVMSQNEMHDRAVSEDGSRIVFTTADPLSPDVSNGLANVYEWHEAAAGGEGTVSLVSGGSGSEPVEDVVMAPEGNDVFFVSTQELVPQDTDSAPDVYDARLGGGFPPVSAEVKQCVGEACYGPLTNPAPLLVPGSVSQAPGENYAPVKTVAPKAKKKPKASVKKKKRAKGSKKRVRGSKASGKRARRASGARGGATVTGRKGVSR